MKTEAEIYLALTDIFREVFGREDLVLSPALTANDVAGWDSFKQIEILICAEEHFGIKFTTREIDSLKNIGDLVQVITSRLPG